MVINTNPEKLILNVMAIMISTSIHFSPMWIKFFLSRMNLLLARAHFFQSFQRTSIWNLQANTNFPQNVNEGFLKSNVL